MSLKTLSFLLLSFIYSVSSQAQNEKQDEKWGRLVKLIEENDQAKGSICISKGQEVLYSNHFDMAEPQMEYRYRIGSISKTFTAVLIMMAVEEGKLNLSDPLKDWYPSFTDEAITIELMLRHKSGLHNFTDDASFAQIMELEQSEEAMITRFSQMELDFEPGSKQAYSNTNFVLLSYILQKEYDLSYAQILQQKIIGPLDLKNTYFAQEEPKDELERQSYVYNGKWVEGPHTHPSVPMGAGGIISTPRDLNIFFQAIFSQKLISQESLNAMLPKEEMGMGLIRFPFQDKVAYGHNGGIDGFVSHASYLPSEDISIAVCLNGMRYPINSLLIDFLSITFELEDYELPEFKELELDEATLNKYTGTYKSANFPLDIKIFIEEGVLKGQASGQGAFPLSAVEENVFEFKAAQIKMTFLPEENLMHFEQGGMKLAFTR